MIEQNDWRLVFMKRNEAMNATGFCNILTDRWFAVHPETGDLIFFQPDKRKIGSLIGASPQCNPIKGHTEHLQQKLYPWATVAFVEKVAYPIAMGDY